MARYGDHQLDSLYFYLNSGSIWVYSFSVFFSARSWRYSTISSRWCSLLRSSWRSVVNVCSTLEPDHSAVIALRYSAAVPSPEWFSTSRHYLNSSLNPSWPYVPPFFRRRVIKEVDILIDWLLHGNWRKPFVSICQSCTRWYFVFAIYSPLLSLVPLICVPAG